MKISKKGIDLIKEFEGFRSCPYQDSAGVWTIGYGTTRIMGRPVTHNDVCIGKDTAERILRHQINSYYSKYVTQYLDGIDVTQDQFDALVSFAYNVGLGALKRSTLLKKLRNGDYEGASMEFLRWTHAGGKKLKGLVARREKEAKLFLA